MPADDADPIPGPEGEAAEMPPLYAIANGDGWSVSGVLAGVAHAFPGRVEAQKFAAESGRGSVVELVPASSLSALRADRDRMAKEVEQIEGERALLVQAREAQANLAIDALAKNARLEMEVARLSGSEAEIRAKVAGEIEAKAAEFDAKVVSYQTVQDRDVYASMSAVLAIGCRSAARIARREKGKSDGKP